MCKLEQTCTHLSLSFPMCRKGSYSPGRSLPRTTVVRYLARGGYLKGHLDLLPGPPWCALGFTCTSHQPVHQRDLSSSLAFSLSGSLWPLFPLSPETHLAKCAVSLHSWDSHYEYFMVEETEAQNMVENMPNITVLKASPSLPFGFFLP